MINDISSDAKERMEKSLTALDSAFSKIRTGRAHPSILDSVQIDYYGTMTPIKQVANVGVEDARTLAINAWEKHLVPVIEKAIMTSNLGLNPSTSGDIIRVPMPMLTEETRKTFIRQARAEAENARISVRNIRRDANGDIKDLLKDKDIAEDDARRGEDAIQKLTDQMVAKIADVLAVKEKDLMEI